MNYQQLTEPQRYQISALLELNTSVRKIAEIVKCHRATVYRERARHSIDGRYCATRAHSLAQEKRKSARKYRITPDRIDLICWLLSNDWSPEQISNVLTCCNEPVAYSGAS